MGESQSENEYTSLDNEGVLNYLKQAGYKYLIFGAELSRSLVLQNDEGFYNDLVFREVTPAREIPEPLAPTFEYYLIDSEEQINQLAHPAYWHFIKSSYL